MSKCPECNSYSELQSSVKNCLVCPNCKAIFPDEVVRKKLITNKELMAQVSYLQDALLEMGKTNSNMMKHISKNTKAILALKRKL